MPYCQTTGSESLQHLVHLKLWAVKTKITQISPSSHLQNIVSKPRSHYATFRVTGRCTVHTPQLCLVKETTTSLLFPYFMPKQRRGSHVKGVFQKKKLPVCQVFSHEKWCSQSCLCADVQQKNKKQEQVGRAGWVCSQKRLSALQNKKAYSFRLVLWFRKDDKFLNTETIWPRALIG